VGGLVVWLVGTGGERDVAPAASAVVSPRSTPERAGSRGFERLRLDRRGHPVIWMRLDAHVEIRNAPGGRVVKKVDAHTPFGERQVFSVVKRRGPWAGVPTPYLPNDELGWVKLDRRRLRAGWTPYSILVDLSARRGELLRGGRVLRSFVVTIGAPGSETPTGRFAVTDEFHGQLDPAAYGCCQLALTARQTHLPSGWLGGDRIAIHGTYSPLGVAASHGCIRASDADVRALIKTVPLGAPVVIRN
jgi:hypothetical protein